VIAFDADVYASDANNSIGLQVRDLINTLDDNDHFKAMGSVVLLPGLLCKPIRYQANVELSVLTDILSKLALIPVTDKIAWGAVQYGADYKLRAIDTIHLTTAVHAGAGYFLTNNTKDFTKSTKGIEIAYPADIPTLLAAYGAP